MSSKSDSMNFIIMKVDFEKKKMSQKMVIYSVAFTCEINF